MNSLKNMQDRYQRFLKHRQAFDPGAKSWYRMEASDDATDIYIYDAIGFFGVEAESFIRDLDRVESSVINLRINSPGGSVFDGTAMYNALRRHKATVHVQIDGLAASMASIIALAGDTVEMAENAFFMIHNPWSMVVGDSEDMRKEADILDKLSETAIKTYTQNSNLTETQVREAMTAETWYSAEEAKDAGFISNIYTGGDSKSLFDLSVFAHAPKGMSAPKEFNADARGLEAVLRDAGLSHKAAKQWVSDYNAKQRDAASDRHRDDGETVKQIADLLRNNAHSFKPSRGI